MHIRAYLGVAMVCFGGLCFLLFVAAFTTAVALSFVADGYEYGTPDFVWWTQFNFKVMRLPPLFLVFSMVFVIVGIMLSGDQFFKE